MLSHLLKIPTIWKIAVITPVLETSYQKTKDFRSDASTSKVMKWIALMLDFFRFAYLQGACHSSHTWSLNTWKTPELMYAYCLLIRAQPHSLIQTLNQIIIDPNDMLGPFFPTMPFQSADPSALVTLRVLSSPGNSSHCIQTSARESTLRTTSYSSQTMPPSLASCTKTVVHQFSRLEYRD